MQVAAEEEGQSLNAWAMRCMECCIDLRAVEKHLTRIAYVTTTWTSRPDDDAFGKSALASMIETVEEEAEEIVKLLGLAGETRDLITEHAGSRTFEDLVGQWVPHEDGTL
jgi:hypothetical protein